MNLNHTERDHLQVAISDLNLDTHKPVDVLGLATSISTSFQTSSGARRAFFTISEFRAGDFMGKAD